MLNACNFHKACRHVQGWTFTGTSGRVGGVIDPLSPQSVSRAVTQICFHSSKVKARLKACVNDAEPERGEEMGRCFPELEGGIATEKKEKKKKKKAWASRTPLLNHSGSVQRKWELHRYQGSLAIKSSNDINRQTGRASDKSVREEGLFFSFSTSSMPSLIEDRK